jgi:integral membrane protein
MNSPLKRLRYIGISEGISFLVLLGIAMPLKYIWGIPEMVKYTGWAHGLLFVLYLMAVAHVALVYRWSLFKIIGAVLASVVPFGPFILDARLLKKEEAKASLKKVMA